MELSKTKATFWDVKANPERGIEQSEKQSNNIHLPLVPIRTRVTFVFWVSCSTAIEALMTIFFLVRWVVLNAGTEKPRAETDPPQKFTVEEDGHLERGRASIVETKEEGRRSRAQGFWLEGKGTVLLLSCWGWWITFYIFDQSQSIQGGTHYLLSCTNYK